jgi:predicted nucleic acid-binding protein
MNTTTIFQYLVGRTRSVGHEQFAIPVVSAVRSPLRFRRRCGPGRILKIAQDPRRPEHAPSGNSLAYNQDMAEAVNSESVGQDEHSDREQPLVFLDTNVIIGYLRGDASAGQVFLAEASGRIRLAVNPIVLQELLLAADAASRPEFERVRDHLRVLPLDATKAEALLSRVRSLRNRLVHSNDILILSSADECDFLVTRDQLLKELVTSEKPQVVTPEELVTHLRAA